MKILALEVENLKRISVVRIEPDGNLVQITGKNGQGKTSVLDAIWWALAGMKNVHPKPVRDGEDSATIRLDLGALKVTRKFIVQEDGSYTTSIRVENEDGARFGSPQAMLDNLLGELAFDPLNFMRMNNSEQAKTLQHLVTDFDFDKSASDIKKAYEERRVVNKTAGENKMLIQSWDKNLPTECPRWIDVDDEIEALQKAIDSNAKRAGQLRDAEKLGQSIDQTEIRIKELETKLELYKEELKALPEFGAEEDIDIIRKRINDANENNEIVDSFQALNDVKKSFDRSQTKSEDLTGTINEIKLYETAAIAGANMPIKGLSIDNECILVDSIPFSQCSDAEQLRLSVGIAMALNPKLKVIRVRDGSLLDEDSMKLLEKMANESDYQIWIERVDGSGNVGFVMEDGHVKEK